MVAAFVTPSSSHEDEPVIWIDTLERGDRLTESDWQRFSERPKDEQVPSPRPTATVRRWTGMVQDMLDPEYVGRNNGDEQDFTSLRERVPLILTRSIFLDPSSASSNKRVRRCEQTNILAYFYYDQYPPNSPQHQRGPLRLNELVEVVAVACNEEDRNGVIMTPEEQSFRNMFSFDDMELEDASTKEIPRWHVVWYRSVNLLRQPNAQRPIRSSTASIEFDILSSWLHSHSQRRADGNPIVTPDGRCLGCVSLEWIISQPGSVASVVALLQQACPLVRLITNEHDDDLVPEQKATGRLQDAVLQLPPGAIVVVDARSSINARVLGQLCSTHRLDYRFAGGLIPMEADYRILVVSTPETQRKIPCTLTIKTSSVPFDWTWESCSVVGNIQLPSNLLDNVTSIPTNTLDRCLLLARLQAARRDGATVEEEDWRSAVELDRFVREVEASLS